MGKNPKSPEEQNRAYRSNEENPKDENLAEDGEKDVEFEGQTTKGRRQSAAEKSVKTSSKSAQIRALSSTQTRV